MCRSYRPLDEGFTVYHLGGQAANWGKKREKLRFLRFFGTICGRMRRIPKCRVTRESEGGAYGLPILL